MGKIDDMRRQREAWHKEQSGGKPSGAVVDTNAKKNKADAAVVADTKVSDAAEVTEARCSSCGKVKELVNGMIGNHQKGLGKMCPGSRKPQA